MARPVVGISIGALTPERVARQRALRKALHDAGAVPILLRPEEGLDALRRIRGLCLAGGGDIRPHHYAERQHPQCRDFDDERDEVELALGREAVRAGMPILGICRGLQVMVVSCGGTLVQHIPDLPGALRHERIGETDVRHPIRLEPGSLLATALASGEAEVNSNHHQAPGILPDGWRATAKSPDGVCEMVEGPGFLVGVQWHPERDPGPVADAIFKSFVEASAAN